MSLENQNKPIEDSTKRKALNVVDPKAEAFDKEGNARKTHLLPDDSTFYGSEQEFRVALKEYKDNKDKSGE